MPDDNVPLPDIIGPFSSNQGPFLSQDLTFLVFILPLARIIDFANTSELVCGGADGG
jgi:hypothetical protein